MADTDFVSGFIGVGIEKAILQILDHINNAIQSIIPEPVYTRHKIKLYESNMAKFCKQELESVKVLVMKIGPIIMQIQQHCLSFNGDQKDKASDVDRWLKELDVLLRKVLKRVQRCTISTPNVIYRYRSRRMIAGLILDISKHLMSPLVEFSLSHELLVKFFPSELEIPAVGQMRATVEGHMPPASNSSQGSRTNLMDEPLIVGQGKALASLVDLLINNPEAKSIGVLGKAGSGKSLLLKTLFNNQKVRNHFRDGLFLWLTVSQQSSATSLQNDLYKQIAIQKKVVLTEDHIKEEEVKLWLNGILQRSRSFLLVLDDVWESTETVLPQLGIPVTYSSKSKVIVSSRDRAALFKIRGADKYTIAIDDLMEDKSWQLFQHHAFHYNNGNLPSNIDERKAKTVCNRCAGLPLAIKTVGRAMAGNTHPQKWEWALHSLQDAHSLQDCLRFSHDALRIEDVNMQFCFLYLAAAFSENQIINAYEVIQLWVGEGLLAGEMQLQDRYQVADGEDPFDMGRIYVNHLADRCLIEPIMRDVDGQIEYLRMHGVLRDFGIRIAEGEENFYCRVGRGLKQLNKDSYSRCTRILLSNNQLQSLPKGIDRETCTFLLAGNTGLTQIPKKVIGSIISLHVLDLSGTSVQSLPYSVGCLKHLVCLRLIGTPIKRLPGSFTDLVNLRILDLSFSSIRELPDRLDKLRSLGYLGLANCKNLQYLSQRISVMTSLQHLYMNGCSSMWTEPKGFRCKNVASIQNLGGLKLLKELELQNNSHIFNEGTLGNMREMDTLSLVLTQMEHLPQDISNM